MKLHQTNRSSTFPATDEPRKKFRHSSHFATNNSMDHDIPSLTIVIPTYNRGGLLGMLLDSIGQDFDEWPDELELVVMDNASTDDTIAKVENRRESGMPIRLLRNATNVGMDTNLAAGFDAARGKYLWQIGDDEILYRGTCRFVLDFVMKNEFGLMHLSHKGIIDGQQTVHLSHTINSRPRMVEMTSSKIFRQANVFLTFISANVVNRHAILKAFPQFNSKADAGTFLPQLAWIYASLKSVNRHVFVRTPLFGALGGNTGGYRLIEVFGTNLLTITQRSLGDVIPNARTLMANAVLTRLMTGELMAMHAKIPMKCNQFVAEDIEFALEQLFGNMLTYRTMVKPLVREPFWLRCLIFAFVRLYNRLNRTFGFAWL